jgi:hypothetical protein
MGPPTNGDTKVYENLDGRFIVPDVCSYKVAIPSFADLNDHMYFRMEYSNNCASTLIKGKTLDKPMSMYENIKAGQTFTATRGINFFIMFQATAQVSGQYVFSIWFKNVSGSGARA